MKGDDLFFKEIGRLVFCFRKNGRKIELLEVFFNNNVSIEDIREDIRAFPYEREIEKAREEVYEYFGLKYSKKI